MICSVLEYGASRTACSEQAHSGKVQPCECWNHWMSPQWHHSAPHPLLHPAPQKALWSNTLAKIADVSLRTDCSLVIQERQVMLYV